MRHGRTVQSPNRRGPIITPILIIGFNRPDFFERCLEKVMAEGPTILYIHIDGPRTREDHLAQQQMAKFVQNCPTGLNIHFRQLETNLGCGKAVNEAIDWLFEHEEAGIILEDDLLPGHDFFLFVEAGLVIYKDDDRVGQIGGYNPLAWLSRFRNHSTQAVPSPKPWSWGWGTWSNRWHSYRSSPAGQDDNHRQHNLAKIEKQIPLTYQEVFSGKLAVERGDLDTWDYAWAFEFFARGWVCVLPPVNLVQNIGFDNRSTHTRKGTTVLSRSLPKGFQFGEVDAIDFTHERFSQRQSFMSRYKHRLTKRFRTLVGVYKSAWSKIR